MDLFSIIIIGFDFNPTIKQKLINYPKCMTSLSYNLHHLNIIDIIQSHNI